MMDLENFLERHPLLADFFLHRYTNYRKLAVAARVCARLLPAAQPRWRWPSRRGGVADDDACIAGAAVRRKLQVGGRCGQGQRVTVAGGLRHPGRVDVRRQGQRRAAAAALSASSRMWRRK